ncbi:thioredoxin-like protein [Aaosphaeria arxii CBS 175.79]|uniref:Thioredoxin-like protein n=1 Tax=Aaosphaeria arxii CBS 175.79 TaxID=1450172 RepID=A0A6A5XAY0_9PLEO|nr:thioredoxin-like protein [Aaosphaeria arxii CBS 175.79]KAF2010122.1 thioredoxin-like protein [Aaosphaeria arxii CBS 175.79]
MPSQRRMRLSGLLFIVVVIVILYMSSSASRTQGSDFYTRTQEALQSREYEAAAKQRDAEDVGSRLKAAENAAKQSADKKSQKYFESVDGAGNEKSVAGRVKLGEQAADRKNPPGVANVGGRPADIHAAKEDKDETKEQHEAEVELNAILKKSPMIIFSKSYCPYSKKAKNILLKKYKIVPEPFVVELDEHPLGHYLQQTLGQTTGRTTVPNVLLMGKSIGGGDDIEELHIHNKLIDKVKTMGGSRIVEVAHRDGLSMDSDSRSEVKLRV